LAKIKEKTGDRRWERQRIEDRRRRLCAEIRKEAASKR
jgi:hypothetical protein